MMFGWLTSHIVSKIEDAVIWVVNLAISSLAGVISWVVAHCPSLPSVPTFPSGFSDWIGYGEYWFPITWLLSEGVILLALWFAWMGVAVLGRWAKLVRGNQ